MARKRKTVQRKTTQRRPAKRTEVQEVQIKTDHETPRGRYSNHIQLTMQEEEFVVDFFCRCGEQVTLLSRIFITPAHAKRFGDLLRRQHALHQKRFKSKAKR